MDILTKLTKKYQIESSVPLLLGWSRDKKYILKNSSQTFLLRVCDISLLGKKQMQFEYLKRISQLGINCSIPLELESDSENVYMLLTYLEGTDAKSYLEGLDDVKAYKLGVEAGEILKRLHESNVYTFEVSWYEKYLEKAERKIDALINCGRKIPMQERIIELYRENIFLMKDRKMSFTHGDYHVGNLIVCNSHIGVIDFDKAGFSDNYDDFKPYYWNVLVNPYFETGLINGYFENQIPDDFFAILRFYSLETIISHLPWAMGYSESDVKTSYMVAEKIIDWYNSFKLIVPTWYKGIKEW